jgi:hypothetical protein
MANIPELLSGHVTLGVEFLDRLYLNGYIGPLPTAGGLVTFMREQLGKPITSPVALGQVTERFRDAVKALAERQQIPIYQFDHKERKDDVANRIRQQRGIRDGIVFIPPRTAGRWPGCSRGWRPACSGPPWPCSPPTTRFYRSRSVKPWIAWTGNSTY